MKKADNPKKADSPKKADNPAKALRKGVQISRRPLIRFPETEKVAVIEASSTIHFSGVVRTTQDVLDAIHDLNAKFTQILKNQAILEKKLNNLECSISNVRSNSIMGAIYATQMEFNIAVYQCWLLSTTGQQDGSGISYDGSNFVYVFEPHWASLNQTS
jgi:hypothetical protein